MTRMGGTRLKLELDKVPLWRGDHVSLKLLADDFAKYLYLPRLRDADVLLAAVRDGVCQLMWRRRLSHMPSDGMKRSSDTSACRPPMLGRFWWMGRACW